jgi:hypothetical protein
MGTLTHPQKLNPVCSRAHPCARPFAIQARDSQLDLVFEDGLMGKAIRSKLLRIHKKPNFAF